MYEPRVGGRDFRNVFCQVYGVMAMDVVRVKVSEEQKEEIEALAELKQYPSISEYIREAIRDKIERDLPLSEEVQERIEKGRAASDEEYIPYEDVEKKLDPR